MYICMAICKPMTNPMTKLYSLTVGGAAALAVIAVAPDLPLLIVLGGI